MKHAAGNSIIIAFAWAMASSSCASAKNQKDIGEHEDFPTILKRCVVNHDISDGKISCRELLCGPDQYGGGKYKEIIQISKRAQEITSQMSEDENGKVVDLFIAVDGKNYALSFEIYNGKCTINGGHVMD